MTLVELGEIALASESEALIGCALDTPKAEHHSTYFGFDLRGWAIGRESPASVVAARHAGGELRQAEVQISRPDVAERYPQIDWARQ